MKQRPSTGAYLDLLAEHAHKSPVILARIMRNKFGPPRNVSAVKD
jgi:hypothetical protein